MEIDTKCPICLRLDEDGGHCFLKCKFAKECWRALNLEEERAKLCMLSSSMQVSEHIMSLHEEEDSYYWSPVVLVGCSKQGECWRRKKIN